MIPIVFSTDHNYIMPTGVTIASLLMSARGNNYDIYVLISSDVTEKDKNLLTKQVRDISAVSRISFIEMGDNYKDGYEIRGISKACYYRLMIPWLIPDIDKIIYADVDIIFKSPLSELFEVELEDNYVAGAIPIDISGFKGMEKYFKKIGLRYDKYINSGVLLINSKKQREDNLQKEYEKLSKKKFIYQDQDIINIACKGHIKFFDKRFNLKPSTYATEKDLQENVVIHYAGDKPWQTFTYAWSQWWEIYEKSIFNDYRLYHDISAKILNIGHQIKNLRKKTGRKLQFFVSKIKF